LLLIIIGLLHGSEFGCFECDLCAVGSIFICDSFDSCVLSTGYLTSFAFSEVELGYRNCSVLYCVHHLYTLIHALR